MKAFLLLSLLWSTQLMASYVNNCIVKGSVVSTPKKLGNGAWTFQLKVESSGKNQLGRSDSDCNMKGQIIDVTLHEEDRKVVFQKGQVLWLNDMVKDNKGQERFHHFTLLTEEIAKEALNHNLEKKIMEQTKLLALLGNETAENFDFKTLKPKDNRLDTFDNADTASHYYFETHMGDSATWNVLQITPKNSYLTLLKVYYLNGSLAKKGIYFPTGIGFSNKDMKIGIWYEYDENFLRRHNHIEKYPMRIR